MEDFDKELKNIKQWLTTRRKFLNLRVIERAANTQERALINFYKGVRPYPFPEHSLKRLVDVLSLLGYIPLKNIELDKIQNIICSHYKLTRAQLKIKTREDKIAVPRFIAFYFAKEITKKSNKYIAKEIGEQSPAMVTHAIKSINNWIETDKEFNQLIEKFRNKINKAL
jgi:chromosomal replication initiator protein